MNNDQTLLERARHIRLAIFDVDGVLTDSRLYFMPDGTEFKSFNTLDGHGIKMLIASGVETAIISGRSSPLVERRAGNGGFQYLVQGREALLIALADMWAKVPVELAQIAFFGDDRPGRPAMGWVGLGIAVDTADGLVRQHAHGVTRNAG